MLPLRRARWCCAVLLPTLSCTGVGLRVDRTEALDRHMRVDLSRREASVAQQLLNGPQVRAALEHVGGGRVAQPVRSDVRGARSRVW